VPRKLHLLSGLLRCGECNGQMTVTASSRTGQRIGCSAAYNTRSCKHGKSCDLGKLTDLAVNSMCLHLTDPELIKASTLAKTLEFSRLEKENNGARQAAVKQFDRLNIQIAKLVRMIDEEDDMPRELLASLKAKEIERRSLEERIRLLQAESNVTTLHPTVIKAFGKSIETLHAKLKRNPDDPECRMAFGNIIDSIIVHPTENGKPYDISLYARLAAIMGVDLFPAPRTNKEIVAAEGLPRISTDGTALSRPPSSRPFTGWSSH
jgi:site-specific DNA recombinase